MHLISQDFSGQNLRGHSFKDYNLVGANFSYADIRGTDFTGANLEGSNFSYAQAGLQYRWIISLVAISFSLSAITGFASMSASWVMQYWLHSFENLRQSAFILGGLLSLLLIFFLFITISQGLAWGLGTWIVVTVAAWSMALVGVAASPPPVDKFIPSWFDYCGAMAAAMTLALAITLLITFAVGLIVALDLTITWLLAFAMTIIFVLALASSYVLARADSGMQEGIVFWAVTVACLGSYIGWYAVTKDEKYVFVRTVTITLAAAGGASFRNANLTNANFQGAVLKNSDFRGSVLTYACWQEAKKLNHVRFGNCILAKEAVRDILTSRNGYKKNYAGENLQGANLKGVNLSEANLKGADISQSNLQGANLERANLTKVQAVGTDFTHAYLTGACLESWNINNTTKLENVDSRFIYLLEYPDPQTNSYERRPSSGEFSPGDFTKLFQEVLDTVDLIFRNGIDWKAFNAAFEKVQVENEDTQLTIQSIENKGDGFIVVRVSVPSDTNKTKIHSDFTQNYERILKATEEKYQATIEGKDEQIVLYRQQLEESRQREIRQNSKIEKFIDILGNTVVNVPINEREVKVIADRQTSTNLVILTLTTSEFEQDFSVIAQIWTGSNRFPIQHSGKLPSAPEIIKVYHHWRSQYKSFLEAEKIESRLDKDSIKITIPSEFNLDQLAEDLDEKLNKWLNAEQFIPIDRILRERFNRSDEIQIIIQSKNIYARQLPWHLWDFFNRYRKAEISLSSPFYDQASRAIQTRSQVRVLSIIGDDEGINIDKDRQLLTQIGGEIKFLVKPDRQELNQYLWDEEGWDILCFSGHSSSEMDGNNGWICINDTDKVTISELKHGLRTAIERGLQIAIFNSCDSLGLANQLASLHIPQIIVMREPVPDIVAQEFLKHFLTAFAGGKSFYLSVREAREKLQSLEHHFPCASWLPVICQNPAEIPPTWNSLRHNS